MDSINKTVSTGQCYPVKLTVRDFVMKYGFSALKGVKILSFGNKIVYIHNNFFTPERIKEFKGYKKQPYRFRVYGGDTPDAELVNWIFSSDIVIP